MQETPKDSITNVFLITHSILQSIDNISNLESKSIRIKSYVELTFWD